MTDDIDRQLGREIEETQRLLDSETDPLRKQLNIIETARRARDIPPRCQFCQSTGQWQVFDSFIVLQCAKCGEETTVEIEQIGCDPDGYE